MNLLHRATLEENLEGMHLITESIQPDQLSGIVNDHEDTDGWTPLLWAVQRGNLEAVQFLIDKGASVDATKGDKMGALHIAASNNDIHTIDYLTKLQVFPTVDIQNEEGWTPAHLAGFLNNFDSLNLLIERGSDICIKHS